MTKVMWAFIGAAYFVFLAAAWRWAPGFVGPLLMVGVGAGLFFFVRHGRALQNARNEALFVSMFPDLQPHFHPAKLFEYAIARRKETLLPTGKAWKDPPGFAGRVADIRFEGEREVVRLLDAAGQVLAQFVYEKLPGEAAFRVGKGKFTVTTSKPEEPRVRYWHPQREFKWTPGAWRFKTPMADQPIVSSERGSSFSSDSASSSSRTAAAAAGFAAAGGTFDGGGASQAWSDAGGSDAGGSDSGGSDSGGSGAAVAATSY